MAISTCSGCNEVFNSVGTFDKHRIGDYKKNVYVNGKVVGQTPNKRRCLSSEEMLAIGMFKNDKGRWAANVYKGYFERVEDDSMQLL